MQQFKPRHNRGWSRLWNKRSPDDPMEKLITDIALSLAERNDQIGRLTFSVIDRDRRLGSALQALAEREQQLTGLKAHSQALQRSIAAQEQSAEAMRTALAQRDEDVKQLDKLNIILRSSLEARDGTISQLNEALGERNRRIDVIPGLESELHDRNTAIEQLSSQIALLLQEAVDLHHKVGDRDRTIEYLKNDAVRLEQTVESLHHTVRARDRTIETLNIRVATARNPLLRLRRLASDASRWCWHKYPAPTHVKLKVKDRVFGALPQVFGWTQAYKLWERSRRPIMDWEPLASMTPATQQQPGDEFVPLRIGAPPQTKPAKLICFYLPQFHAIPENDAWWGPGFTEWTNVKPARPQFEGHYQPHVPGELGYYDLNDPAVQRRQVELAKLYGIGGFCFYFYWFNGKRLLDMPIDSYVNSDLDLPFCLCWANEDWSRRWDGGKGEVLISQHHCADDDLAFIDHVSRYMRDSRYIRVGGKPLLVVYRPSLLPSAIATAKRWRDRCLANGVGEIYLAYTQSFDVGDPARYGFDAAVEFPPNNSSPPKITDEVAPLAENFASTIYDWRVFVERSKNYQQYPHRMFRTVCPSWDNTPRKKNLGAVFLNSSPELYQQWLENAIADTEQRTPNPADRLIFVNAWNEWAEGAHLEPDARYGYAFLEASRRALERSAARNELRVVLVSHDAYPHGAQMLSLHLAKTLGNDLKLGVDLVCLGDGPLKAEFARWATVHDLAGIDPCGPQASALARRLYEANSRIAIVNTAVSGDFLKTLAEAGVRCISLIHELSGVLQQYGLQRQANAIAAHATKVVFAADMVANSFTKFAPLNAEKIEIRPQGLYKRRLAAHDKAADRATLRKRLGLADSSWIVLGAGYADHRKGVDLFVEAGLAMAQRVPQARWVWIGHWEQDMQRRVDARLEQAPALKERFLFPGLQTDTDVFYGGADVFALTSREDPFPSVLLEAMDAKLPVVAFAGSGGFTGLFEPRHEIGCLVPCEDAVAFAKKVGDLLENPDRRAACGARGSELIEANFSFRAYVFDLLALAGAKLARVSVVVPNYNYARYLPERLASICNQDHPIGEIIFLDDCSTDNSVQVARDFLQAQHIDYRIIVNERNSGSVFAQWKKGVDLARGGYVWIAEADDLSTPQFLRCALEGFKGDVVLSYCESRQIDSDGNHLADNYLAYVEDIGQERWVRSFANPGAEEVAEALSVKNTIPNVSAAIFDARRLRAVLDENIQLVKTFRFAGDWLVYVLLLRTGDVAFSPVACNLHRRHGAGVTISGFNQAQLDEIRKIQKFVAEEFSVPAEKMRIANEYLGQLARQFGLTSERDRFSLEGETR
jgi:O-antigen biosynthesis protein